MINDYEFNNYLTTENVEEVFQRVQNIFGKPGVFFSVSNLAAGLKVVDLHTRVQIENPESSILLFEDGFQVLCPGTLSFGAHTRHKNVTNAYRDHANGLPYVFITITGGNGLKGLLQQQIKIQGRNSYGVFYHLAAKVEDESTTQRVENEAQALDQVANLLESRGVDKSIIKMLRQDATDVRSTWESVLVQH